MYSAIAKIFSLCNNKVLYLTIYVWLGSIPAEIGNALSLVDLQVSGNEISEEIPEAIGNLGNLTRLDLSSNYIVGTPIPRELCCYLPSSPLRCTNVFQQVRSHLSAVWSSYSIWTSRATTCQVCTNILNVSLYLDIYLFMDLLPATFRRFNLHSRLPLDAVFFGFI